MHYLLTLVLMASVMPASEFEALRQRVDDASFSKDQISIVASLPKSVKLSCAQTVLLLKEVSFADDQMKIVKHLTPRISDLNNRHQIIAVFSMSSAKKRAGRLLDAAYADQTDALHAQQSAKKKATKEQNTKLEACSKRLAAQEKSLKERAAEQEKSLKERAAELDKRELQLMKRERRLDAQKGQPKARPNQRAARGQRMSWVGYCPMGVDSNNVSKGDCLSFDATNFSPVSKHGQRLMMQVDRPGDIKLRIEAGPKVKQCRRVGSSTRITKQVVKATVANQLLDVTPLIEDWDASYIRVTANSKGKKASILIEDWQKCGAEKK